jgi:hypothetical protein
MQKISNVQAATLRPILNEKLSPNAKEFVADSQSYGWILPTEKHTEVSRRRNCLAAPAAIALAEACDINLAQSAIIRSIFKGREPILAALLCLNA